MSDQVRPSLPRAGSLTQLFGRFRDEALRRARGWIGRSRARGVIDPEDVVQEASAEFLRKPRTWRDEDHFANLFFRFVKHTVGGLRRRDGAKKRGGDVHVRHFATTTSMHPAGETTGPAAAVARDDENAHLLRYLRRLKPEYQQVIELRLRDDLSWSDIADRMGLSSDDAARKKYDYAMVRLEQITGLKAGEAEIGE